MNKFFEDKVIEEIFYDVWHKAGARLHSPTWGEAASRMWEAVSARPRRREGVGSPRGAGSPSRSSLRGRPHGHSFGGEQRVLIHTVTGLTGSTDRSGAPAQDERVSSYA
jgi:hypothetical protein